MKSDLRPRRHPLLVTLVMVCIYLSMALLSRFIFAASKPSGGGGGKPSSRWTLQEWLTQKQNNRLMDQWLALHSSTPHEFLISADFLTGKNTVKDNGGTGTTTSENHQTYSVLAGAYISIVGLEGFFENSPNDQKAFGGSFNLRILGRSVQTTQLSLQYGMRGYELSNALVVGPQNTEKFTQQFAGAHLCLYILKVFGIDGTYQQYLAARGNQETELTGSRVQVGPFIDYQVLRVYGQWFNESLTFTPAGAAPSSNTVLNRGGVKAGVAVYF